MMYKGMRDEGMRDETVSKGLHRATRTLRDRWVDGENLLCEESRSSGVGRDAELSRGSELRQPLWVPYVHFGV